MRVPATPAGHDQPRDFVRSHGRIRMIGIEGTGSYGAGLARAPVGRRRADPRGHPSQALPAPPRQVRSDRRLRRRRQSTGRGRRPARGQDRHRPLRTDPGAPGLAPQRDESPRRRPPADHRPAGHRPRRRAHPPRTASAARGLIDALARTRPAPATHRPRIGDRASAAPPGSAATGSRADEIADIDTELRALTARAAPTMLATKGYGVITTATLLAGAGDNPDRIRTEASFAALCGAAPIPRRPREDQPPPTQPRRRPTGQPGAAPQRPARPATRAPRPTPPASPPRARTAKRYCAAPERAIAREAWHLPAHPRPAPRTDDLRRLRHERGLTPRPSRPPPEHPPGPDQRTRTRHTPRHHPHRSIPPMAQHPTTTDPHRLTPIGASQPRPGPSQEPRAPPRGRPRGGEPG